MIEKRDGSDKTWETAVTTPDMDASVAAVMDGYPPAVREQIRKLRRLIYETAAATEDVGALEETLKWGEPAYLTKGGSTIRLAWKSKTPTRYGLYFNCQTNLVDSFRTLFPELTLEGNRAIVFEEGAALPEETLSACIAMALTYHRGKKKRR